MSSTTSNQLEETIYPQLKNLFNNYEVLKWLSEIYPYKIDKLNLYVGFIQLNFSI